MKSIFLSIIFIPLSLVFGSCILKYDLIEGFYRLPKVEQRSVELTQLKNEADIKSLSSGSKYDVLIIADPHFGNENHGVNGPRRETDWFSFITKKDSTTNRSIADNVKFAVCLGDVAEHGYEEEFLRYKNELLSKLKEIKTALCPDGIKLYDVAGNHDLYNSGWSAWCKNTYPGLSFYKFETPSFAWYFLDSASGTLGAYQMEAFEKDILQSTKRNLLFTHIPLYSNGALYFKMQDTGERNRIISLCGRTDTIMFFDGHTHNEVTTDFVKFTEYNIPGFLEKYGFAILHIDEESKTARTEVVYY